LVLAHLDPAQSAEVIRSLESDWAVDVVRRMATLEPPNPVILETIAADILTQLEEAPPIVGSSDPSARLRQVAELLNNSPTEIEKNVIESLAEEDVAMADELREYMFTWEDIATIDKRTMQKILGTVDTKTLSIALKACSSEVADNVLGNLSSRVRDMVAEERDLAGAMPMTDVTAARGEIMTNIRAMIEAGEFRPSRGGDELVS
jgi:flagellar motor switch protein FliG